MQFGAVGVQALEGAGPPDQEGWVRVEIPVEGQDVAVSDLLRLGAEAEVLGPPELRRAVARTVKALADHYAIPESTAYMGRDASSRHVDGAG